jgi:UDP-glucuronate decarboxylase
VWVKRALVAGGAGFLGSHLVDSLLADGYNVVVLDNLITGQRKNLPYDRHDCVFVQGDVRDPWVTTDLRRTVGGFNVVINMACPASPPTYQHDPVGTLMTNVVGTKNLLDVAKYCGATFMQASTSEVYGDPTVHPQRETYRGTVNCFGPRACYDEGKRAAETLCYDYHTKDFNNVSVKVFRIFNTYGPRMSPTDGRVVTNFVTQALRDEPITLYGGGRQTRSLCYVDDLIRGIRSLMETPPKFTGPVNLGNPHEVTIRELGAMILRLLGKPADMVEDKPLPTDDPLQRCPDITLAREVLKWQPEVDIEAGLQKTIAYLRREVAR